MKCYFPRLRGLSNVFLSILDVTCNLKVYENTKVIINNTTCNGITIYECEHGYYLAQGNLQRTCLTGGMWSGLPPVCERKSVFLHKNTVYNYVYIKVRRHILLLNICTGNFNIVFGCLVLWSIIFIIGTWFIKGVIKMYCFMRWVVIPSLLYFKNMLNSVQA